MGIEMHYGEPEPVDMCCTANAAVAGAYSTCKALTDESSCLGTERLCIWTACSEVGYCVDPKDETYFDEELEFERRSLMDLEAEYDADYQHAPPTPKPTMQGGWGNPKPSNPPKTTYLQETPAPTPRQTGWGADKPLTGCQLFVRKGQCSQECVWKSGYPPMAFSEQSDYELIEEEFAVNGYGVEELLNNGDFTLFFGIGLLIAAVLVYAFRAYAMRKEKALSYSETTPLVKV